MVDLIIRSLLHELSGPEESELEKWRLRSPENERRYQEIARLWQLEPWTGPVGTAPERPVLDQIIQAAEKRRRGVAQSSLPIQPGSLDPAARPRPLRRARFVSEPWYYGAAAMVAGLVLGVGMLRMSLKPSPEAPLAATEFVTGAKETATVNLTDGTIVRLAPNSVLRLPSDRSGRNVWLEGRAYFAVESDSSRPFVIRTPAGDAIVLGTRFELKTEETNLRLVVVEGKVALDAGGEVVEVGADEVSHVRDGTRPEVARIENVHELLDWPDGLLIFRSTPLAQVGREIERHFGVRFEFSDTALTRRKVTGWFTDETLEEVLAAVCRASDVTCLKEDELVVVRP